MRWVKLKTVSYPRYLITLFTAVTLCILLASCGIPKPPNESKIAQDLPSELLTISIKNPTNKRESDDYTMDVASVSIEKRQTNEKNDHCYCSVELDNEYFRFTKYLELDYVYYDKGEWILEGYREYKKADLPNYYGGFYPNEKQLKILSDVIDQYSKFVKEEINNNNQRKAELAVQFPDLSEDETISYILGDLEDEHITALSEQFPHALGDDAFWDLQYNSWTGNVNDFGFEIMEANQYNTSHPRARELWELAIENEFYDGFSNPTAFAEVIVKWTFDTSDVSFSDTEAYCDILLIQDGKTWGILYVDDLWEESPGMSFPDEVVR